jgi:hypothetical protein
MPKTDATNVCGPAGRGCVYSSPAMISPVTFSGSAQRSSYVARRLAGDVMLRCYGSRGRAARNAASLSTVEGTRHGS